MAMREVREQIRGILAGDGWREGLAAVAGMPSRQVAGALFSLLLSRDEALRWRAVTAFGEVLARMADEEPEQARVVLRQMLWRMNEESGSIGWGIPEAMGEAMARSELLAREYHKLLLSYVRELESCDDNFLEHPPLRWGVWWGLARLAEVRPGLLAAAGALDDFLGVLRPEVRMEGREFSTEGLTCHDAQSRGLAALALGRMAATVSERAGELRGALEAVVDDAGSVRLFRGGELESVTVGELAREALGRLPQGGRA